MKNYKYQFYQKPSHPWCLRFEQFVLPKSCTYHTKKKKKTQTLLYSQKEYFSLRSESKKNEHLLISINSYTWITSWLYPALSGYKKTLEGCYFKQKMKFRTLFSIPCNLLGVTFFRIIKILVCLVLIHAVECYNNISIISRPVMFLDIIYIILFYVWT